MKVAAILVCYQKGLNLDEIANKLSECIDATYIVDNSPEPQSHIKKNINANQYLIYNNNIGGLAGAYNKAISEILNSNQNITHVLFLDDDTSLINIHNFLEDSKTNELLKYKNVAAVAPKQRDASTKILSTYIELHKWHYVHKQRDDVSYSFITFLINSMSLWKVGALKDIGEYSTELFLDHVDTDYCLRAKEKGYVLAINHNIEFLHTIGNRKKYKFMGLVMQATGHGPVRRKLIARNTVILMKKYSFIYPGFFLLCLIRIFYELLGILMAENKKNKKLIAFAKGLWNGVKH